MASVKEGLSRVTNYEGITLAVLVGRDGLMIEGVSKHDDENLEIWQHWHRV